MCQTSQRTVGDRFNMRTSLLIKYKSGRHILFSLFDRPLFYLKSTAFSPDTYI